MQSPCNKANTIMTKKKKKFIIPTFLDIEWVLCVGSSMCADGHTPSVERLSLLDTWTQVILSLSILEFKPNSEDQLLPFVWIPFILLKIKN